MAAAISRLRSRCCRSFRLLQPPNKAKRMPMAAESRVGYQVRLLTNSKRAPRRATCITRAIFRKELASSSRRGAPASWISNPVGLAMRALLLSLHAVNTFICTVRVSWINSCCATVGDHSGYRPCHAICRLSCSPPRLVSFIVSPPRVLL